MLVSLSLLGTIFFFKTCPPSFYKMSPWSRLGTLLITSQAGMQEEDISAVPTFAPRNTACFQFDKLYHRNRTVRHKQVLSAMWMASPKFTVSKRVLRVRSSDSGEKRTYKVGPIIFLHSYSSKKKIQVIKKLRKCSH